MKTAQLIGTTALMCLLVAACAQTKEEQQARIAGKAGSRPASTTAKYDLSKQAYTSANLIMLQNTAQSSANSGQWILNSADSKEIFARLQVREQSGEKKGANIDCASNSDATQTCIMKFDYRTGTVKTVNTIQKDEQAKTVEEGFKSNSLIIVDKADQGRASLSLSGEDAHALWDSMSAQRTPNKGFTTETMIVTDKIGENITCSEIQSTSQGVQPSYTCVLRMSSFTGTVERSADSTRASADTTPAEQEKSASNEAETTTETVTK